MLPRLAEQLHRRGGEETQGSRMHRDQNQAHFATPTGGEPSVSFRVLDTRTFWVSHLTSDGKRKSRTSREISSAIASLADGAVWNEGPSFYVFRSYATIGHIAYILRMQRRVKDILVVGSFTHAECRIVGPYQDPQIFDLLPFAKKG